MRKLLIALAILIGAVIPISYTVHEAKPASAATYCAPWQDLWCYFHFLKCGPYNYKYGYYWDNCGGPYL